METLGFKSRALHEGSRYGDDAYVFLRELAQNARDARASLIEVSLTRHRDSLELAFSDDGCGMSFEHAKRFLFRLYASSKEGAADSAGRYGVGFWSILRFQPDELRIESSTSSEDWAVAISGDLSRVRRYPRTLNDVGTRVILRRRLADDESFETIDNLIRQRLSRYCRYLRRAGRRRRSLPVTFNGRAINEPMMLDGPVTLRFSSWEAEGVVGLGPEPRVELYARGLWVKTVSVLEELEPNVSERRPLSPGEGLAPVVILNSERLELVLSRDEPLNDRALSRLLRLARAKLDRLVEQAINGVAPESIWERIVDRCARMIRSVGGVTAASIVVASIALIAVTAMGARSLWSFPAEDRSEPPVASDTNLPELGQPYAEITGYRGATIDVPRPTAGQWSLSVDTQKPLYFRALALDNYDEKRGWTERSALRRAPYPDFECQKDCVTVRMAARAKGGRLTIPVPTSYRLEPDSVRWNGEPVDQVLVDESDNASLAIDEQTLGLLAYSVGPAKASWSENLVEPAPARLNGRWERFIQRQSHAPKNRAALAVTRRVRRRLDYDVSAATAQSFLSHTGSWAERVLATGAGDCDVKNGFNVLLFRRLQIPSRLAVGMVAVGGQARSGLHAWTEYIDGDRWRVADATGGPAESADIAAEINGAAGSAEVGAPGEALTVYPQTRRRAARAASSSSSSTSPVFSRSSPTLPMESAKSERIDPQPVSVDDGGSFGSWLHAALGLVVLGGAVFAFRRRIGIVAETVERRGENDEQRAAVAGILRELLRGSAGWRGVKALGHRRVLPTLEGPAMSLVEAVERSRRGRLWVAGRRCVLARQASAAGSPILDSDDGCFGALVTQSFDVIDIEMIERLNATQLPRALAELVNPCLERIAGVTCVWSRGLGERAMFEYDLSALELGESRLFPPRAIIINPDHPDISALLQLSKREPIRGAYSWIDWFIGQSLACEHRSEQLRREAANAFFLAQV